MSSPCLNINYLFYFNPQKSIIYFFEVYLELLCIKCHPNTCQLHIFYLNSKLQIKCKYPTNKIKRIFYFDILPLSPTYLVINLLIIPINIQKSKIQVFDI